MTTIKRSDEQGEDSDRSGRKTAVPGRSGTLGESALTDPGSAVASEPLRYDLLILQSLRRVLRAVEIYSRKLSASHRITAPQLVCLLTLVEEGPLTATSIARRVYLSPSTVIGILDRLEEKGLIVRERDTRDRRHVNISVTELGASVARSAPSPLQDALVAALDRLPEEEQADIAKALERLVDFLEAGQLDAAPILQVGPISDGKKETGDSQGGAM